MVKLEELEDEHFLEKPSVTQNEVLLADDDDDYTDTGMCFTGGSHDSEISDASDVGDDDETILDRIAALQDIVPPQARAKISSVSSTIASATSTGINYGGKGLWILVTSILLLGLPYALALGDEQQIQEEERQRVLMQEGAQGLINAGDGEAKPTL